VFNHREGGSVFLLVDHARPDQLIAFLTSELLLVPIDVWIMDSIEIAAN
jgi:hypothetical protein